MTQTLFLIAPINIDSEEFESAWEGKHFDTELDFINEWENYKDELRDIVDDRYEFATYTPGDLCYDLNNYDIGFTQSWITYVTIG